ncbi:helix-turn-helix domain-containing protein, partial [Nocardia farcinica]|uniref:helix-turn-helix domain-containing protein n=1 Tax=Nocardia farcinica TaxID=37329 RepID=UPI001E36210F
MTSRLESAMLRARIDSAALAAIVGVDVKTVSRWLGGRVPHRRTRIRIAEVLQETEETLWPAARPDLLSGAPATAEVVGAYAHRADIPTELWVSLLHSATERIDIIGYAYPFVLELLPDAAAVIAAKCHSGCEVRLGFADPDCAHVMERDSLEQMGGTLSGRIRNALSMLGPLADTPGCTVGLHSAHLYNSVFRFDSEMIVTPYLFRARGYQHAALHLRRLSQHGIFESFADQFEQIWGAITPYPSNSQILWIGSRQATSDTGVSGEGSGVMSTGRSRSLPLWNTA